MQPDPASPPDADVNRLLSCQPSNAPLAVEQHAWTAGPLRPRLAFTDALMAFGTLIEKTMRARLAYRVSTIMSMLASAAGYSIFLLVWSEVYRQRGSTPGVPSSQIFSYLVAALVLNFALASSLESRAGLRIVKGLITADLSKPMGFMPWQLGQAIGDFLSNWMLVLPLAVLGLISFGHRMAPPSLAAAALGIVSIVLGFLVNFALGFLTIQAFFVTDSYYGVAFTRIAFHQAFSGLSAPLALFPEPLRALAACLPFRHIIETPARVWLGHVDELMASHLILLQALWVLVLLLLGAAIFRLALRRVQIQGG